MNKRLKELARQAKPSQNLIWEDAELERFAELVRADEREACASLCYSEGKVRLAETIRARGEK
jgi:hypothetical protein